MCKLFSEWSTEIQEFCDKNNYSFAKAKKLSKNWGKDFLTLAYYDPNKKSNGLLDDTPMPAVLLISKEPDGSLKFEQTEHTKKYLS